MIQLPPGGKKAALLLLSALFAFCLAACDSSQTPALTPPYSSSTENDAATVAEGVSELALDDYLIAVALEQAEKISLRADPFFLRLVNKHDPAAFAAAADYRDATQDNLQSIDAFTINAQTNEVLRALLGADYLAEIPGDLSEAQLAGIGDQAPLILPQMVTSQLGTVQMAASAALNFATQCPTHRDFAAARCIVLNYTDDLSIWVVFSGSAIDGRLHVDVMASRSYDGLWADLEQIMNRVTEARVHYDSWAAPQSVGQGGTGSVAVETKMPLDDYLVSLATAAAGQVQQKAHPFLLGLVQTPQEIMSFASDYGDILPNAPKSVELFTITSDADRVLQGFMSESDYNEFVDEAPGALTKEQLALWREDIGQRAPFMVPQWINNLVGSGWVAAAGLLNYSAEYPSHKDFAGTQCVQLNYGDYQGLWVIFTQGSTDTLNVYAVATRSFEELRGYGDSMWAGTEALLGSLCEGQRPYN